MFLTDFELSDYAFLKCRMLAWGGSHFPYAVLFSKTFCLFGIQKRSCIFPKASIATPLLSVHHKPESRFLFRLSHRSKKRNRPIYSVKFKTSPHDKNDAVICVDPMLIERCCCSGGACADKPEAPETTFSTFPYTPTHSPESLSRNFLIKVLARL